MQQVIAEILAQRRNRAIAIILGCKERECDRHLPPEVSQKLRKVVLDQMNEFYDLCLDVMRSLDTGDVVLNEHYVRLLEEVHEAVMSGANANGK